MSEIIRGMHGGDISTVATALSGAVQAGVSIPDQFLADVKRWMDSRQQSAAVSGQMAAPVFYSATQPVAPPRDAFSQLHDQLEQAIKRGDTQAMSTILQSAAELAGAVTPPPGAVTPLVAQMPPQGQTAVQPPAPSPWQAPQGQPAGQPPAPFPWQPPLPQEPQPPPPMRPSAGPQLAPPSTPAPQPPALQASVAATSRQRVVPASLAPVAAPSSPAYQGQPARTREVKEPNSPTFSASDVGGTVALTAEKPEVESATFVHADPVVVS